MGWAEEIDAYCVWLVASGSSRPTLRLRRHYLTHLAQVCADPWAVTTDDLVRFVASPGWAPETRKTARGTVRSFYAWAVDAERIMRDPARRLPPVRVPRSIPRPAPDHVLKAALAAAPQRERVMLLLAALAGLRISEIASLRVQDVTPATLYIRGKGGRRRAVPLHPSLAPEVCGLTVGRLEGWVFPGRRDGHLSPEHVGVLLGRLLGPGWSAHKLRHRFATRTYAAERDLLAVQQLLGHTKPETTARYVALPDDALRTAVSAA